MTYSKFPVLVALCLTAACGGTGIDFDDDFDVPEFDLSPSGNQFPDDEPTTSSFEELATLGNAYDAKFTNGSENIARLTTDSEMPTAGTADFTGVMMIAPPRTQLSTSTDFLGLGKTTIAIDFGAGTVDGTVGDFHELGIKPGVTVADLTNSDATLDLFTGTPVLGSASFDLVSVAGYANLYVGGVEGRITPMNGATFSFDQALGGGLMGPDADGFRAVTASDFDRNIQVFALED